MAHIVGRTLQGAYILRVFCDTAPQIKKKQVSAKAVLFFRKKKVLVLQKANGTWDLPGGRLKSGEGWVEGLAREVLEESGLKIDDADWVSGWLNNGCRDKAFLKGIFVCQLDYKPKKSRIVLSDEHVKGDFFSLKKVKELAMPKEYAWGIDLAAKKLAL